MNPNNQDKWDNMEEMINFKAIWADNGDKISMIYTGTGATTSMVTRTGQKNINSLIDH